MRVAVACDWRRADAQATAASVRREAPLLADDGVELRMLSRRGRRRVEGGHRHGDGGRRRVEGWWLDGGGERRRSALSSAVETAEIALALARLPAGGAQLLDARGVHAAAAAIGALRLRRRDGTRLVVSLDEEDLLTRLPAGDAGATERALRGASLTIVASAGLQELARAAGARSACVVHPGVELPERASPARREAATIVIAGELLPRTRAGDVIRAVAVLRDRHPQLRCEIVGEGSERGALRALALRLRIAERVELTGALSAEETLARVRRATVYAMPSTEEAFGRRYLDAMAAGVPAIGCRGEPGPEEIAAAGAGLVLVPPGDIERLSQRLDELLSDPARLRSEAIHARETVQASFTWERRARALAAAYELALAEPSAHEQALSG
ncbi:MAG: glycosyltransferase family 4 protein [Solirubrobacteraceae bacterium]